METNHPRRAAERATNKVTRPAEIAGEQRWFWDAAWQTGEREASAEVATGQTTPHATAEEMFSALDR